MAVNGITATYVSSNKFSVTGNQTADFHSGRRCRAQLTSGYVYSTISGSSYSSNTLVTLDESELDATLTKVWYGVGIGPYGSLPDHLHDGTEGSGGIITVSGTGGDSQWATISGGIYYDNGKVYIGDSANTGMTQGLTINQDDNDDEILAFKSSDVGHSRTTLTEADTFAAFKKLSADGGGLQISSFSDGNAADGRGLQMAARVTTALDNSKDDGTVGIYTYFAGMIDGDAEKDCDANGAIAVYRARRSSSWDTIWILDEDGDTWQSGSIFVNEASNANMTVGLTLNQGSNTDHIFELKADYVDQPATARTESDSYAFIHPVGGAAGGVSFWGLGDDANTIGMRITGVVGNNSPGVPPVVFRSAKSDGSDDITYLAATEEIFRIDNWTNAQIVHIYGSGQFGIGDSNYTYNANQAIGLTIDQRANDDETISLKSSDVTHGCTGWTETNTFGFLKKNQAATGGILMHGFTDSGSNQPIVLRAFSYDALNTTNGQGGAVAIQVGLISGAGLDATMTPDGKLFSVSKVESGPVYTSVFDIDEDGDTWQTGGATFGGDILFGANTISGTGDIYCNDIHTVGTTIYLGDVQLSSPSTSLIDFGGAGLQNITTVSGTDITCSTISPSNGWSGSIPTVSGTITVENGIITNYVAT
jgi:hypothetical protein